MTGRLLSEPALLLGHCGRTYQRSISTKKAAAPMTKKDSAHPKRCPILVPSGTPRTVATMVPPITAAKPVARLPAGAMRAASGFMMDQNIECASATPMRVA